MATSEIDENDQDFTDRVRRHQKDRGDRWITIEESLEPSKYLEKMKGKVVLVDCSTKWLTNYMAQEGLFSLDGTSEMPKGDGEIQDAAERALRKIEAEVRKKCCDTMFKTSLETSNPNFVFLFVLTIALV